MKNRAAEEAERKKTASNDEAAQKEGEKILKDGEEALTLEKEQREQLQDNRKQKLNEIKDLNEQFRDEQRQTLDALKGSESEIP